jgi:hypothetical protein
VVDDMPDLILLLRTSATIPDFNIEEDHNSARYLIIARRDGES